MGKYKRIAIIQISVTTDDSGDWYNAEVLDGAGHSFAAVGSGSISQAIEGATTYVKELSLYGVMK